MSVGCICLLRLWFCFCFIYMALTFKFATSDKFHWARLVICFALTLESSSSVLLVFISPNPNEGLILGQWLKRRPIILQSLLTHTAVAVLSTLR